MEYCVKIILLISFKIHVICSESSKCLAALMIFIQNCSDFKSLYSHDGGIKKPTQRLWVNLVINNIKLRKLPIQNYIHFYGFVQKHVTIHNTHPIIRMYKLNLIHMFQVKVQKGYTKTDIKIDPKFTHTHSKIAKSNDLFENEII